MDSIAPPGPAVIGGVDSHQDLNMAAVIDAQVNVLGVQLFSTNRAGYRALLGWMRGLGNLPRVGVESTGSYGAGLTRRLALARVPVLEVTGPDGAQRRARGKDDTLDASEAARAAASGRRVQVAQDRTGAIEALRVLRTTRHSAIKAPRAALQLLHTTVVTAPDEVRDQVRNLTRMERIRTCAGWRPKVISFRDPVVATKIALRSIARRILDVND